MSVAFTPRFPVYVTGSTTAARALVLLQEGFGVNDHVRGVADRFSDEGYFVVAPHLYHRSGSPEIAYDDVARAVEEMAKLTLEGLTNDLNATTEFLNSHGFERSSIGTLGFCMGGSVSFFAATLGSVGAAVTFYGGGVRHGRMGLPPLLDLAPSLVTPWLGLFGELDQGIPIDDVEALRDVTAHVSVDADIMLYPDVHHGFHCDARPEVYDEAAAIDAKTRAFSFLAQHLDAR